VYRKQKTKEAARFPFIPGSGFSAKAQRAIASILKEPGTAAPAKVEFKWSRLDPDEIVRLEPNSSTIHLNSRYRKDLYEGGTNDAPVLKMALLFLLQGDLKKSFVRQVSTEWLQRINQAMIASLKD
jgi:hypothetical protein